jgi:glycosyltransferase involved in cell wall biosynthesis
MKLVIFCHPPFLPSQSMPRFAQMLRRSFEALGHEVQMSAPQPLLHKLFARGGYAKWAGYIDQYLIFPLQVRKSLAAASADTMFVFADQALGPWIPLLKNRPHVVHVHDLLNLRSALGEGPGHVTSFSGRLYQRYIRRGFRKARHFISVSTKTRDDLHRYGEVEALTSEVVYNGLHFPYKAVSHDEAFRQLREAGLPATPRGMLLNVGGGQWYKNQRGLLALYARYAADVNDPLPLWCIGPPPNAAVARQLARLPHGGEVSFFQNLSNSTLQAAYSYARAFIFPSLAEGFGWPLIEAQACGCPVITTDEPPMNEVAGRAARYIPRLSPDADIDTWAAHGANVLKALLALGPRERQQLAQLGGEWAKRFDGGSAIARYLEIYQKIFDAEMSRPQVEATLKRL